MEFSKLRGEKAKLGTVYVFGLSNFLYNFFAGLRYLYQFSWQMTGCCRNGNWPSRGQDNNLPAIYFSSSLSDRKKPAKNTPYIFMVCVVTLGSHTVQPPAQRRVSAEFRPGYAGLCLIRSGKLPQSEILQPFYAACSNACLSSLWKGFMSIWNLLCFIVLDSGGWGL